MEEEHSKTRNGSAGLGRERVRDGSRTEAEGRDQDRTDTCTEALQAVEPPSETAELPAPEAVGGEHPHPVGSGEDLRRLLQEKEEQLRQEHDRWMRTYAEHENYKKRVARDKAAQARFGNEALLRALLPVIDNLERSLAHAEQAQNQGAITAGVEMVLRELLRTLETFGLKVISAQGQAFDPLVHEAVSQRESAEYQEQTVIEEVQKGYCLHERLLRPSRVVVATAPQPQET